MDSIRCSIFNAHSGRALRDSVLTSYLYLPCVPRVGELIECNHAFAKTPGHRFHVLGVRYVAANYTEIERQVLEPEHLETLIELLVEEVPMDGTWLR